MQHNDVCGSRFFFFFFFFFFSAGLWDGGIVKIENLWVLLMASLSSLSSTGALIDLLSVLHGALENLPNEPRCRSLSEAAHKEAGEGFGRRLQESMVKASRALVRVREAVTAEEERRVAAGDQDFQVPVDVLDLFDHGGGVNPELWLVEVVNRVKIMNDGVRERKEGWNKVKKAIEDGLLEEVRKEVEATDPLGMEGGTGKGGKGKGKGKGKDEDVKLLSSSASSFSTSASAANFTGGQKTKLPLHEPATDPLKRLSDSVDMLGQSLHTVLRMLHEYGSATIVEGEARDGKRIREELSKRDRKRSKNLEGSDASLSERRGEDGGGAADVIGARGDEFVDACLEQIRSAAATVYKGCNMVQGTLKNTLSEEIEICKALENDVLQVEAEWERLATEGETLGKRLENLLSDEVQLLFDNPC